MSLHPPERENGSGSRRTYSKPFTIIIAVLFVLIVSIFFLSITSYTNCGPSSRAPSEIRAMEAALESYKSDHGKYPGDPTSTEQLKPNSSFDPQSYIASSEFLYSVLSGSMNGTEFSKDPDGDTTYMSFPPRMLKTSPRGKTYLVDPWGNSYGYSTFKAVHRDSKEGNNSSFDLWSIHGGNSADKSGWVTNW